MVVSKTSSSMNSRYSPSTFFSWILFLVVQISLNNALHSGTWFFVPRIGILLFTFGKASKMSLSLSSSLDCANLPGKGTFGGMGLERIEFGTTLRELDGVGDLEGCGKDCSPLVVALSIFSSSDNSCSSTFWLGLDVFGSSPTSLPLPKVIASTISKSPIEFVPWIMRSLQVDFSIRSSP